MLGSAPFLWQHRTNVSLGFSQSFTLEMRYFFLKYTKYSCEKLPFSNEKSQAESSPPICAVLLLNHSEYFRVFLDETQGVGYNRIISK